PELFPKVLAFLPSAHAMVMTDVFPDGRTWHEHLDQRRATTSEAARLGRALARVHHATAAVRTPIRSQGDDWFREHTFDFCLRPTRHPALLHACAELATLPSQQLVWPATDDAPFRWRGLDGRLLRNAVVITVPEELR
ncbi:MAG: hypothetical protein ACRDRA_17580, partial [Pseudonocardiaceae bacterium]